MELKTKILFLNVVKFLRKIILNFKRPDIQTLTFPYRSKKYYEVGDKGLRILEDIKKF